MTTPENAAAPAGTVGAVVRRCAIYGPCDATMCDEMKSWVDDTPHSPIRRNRFFGTGGDMSQPLVNIAVPLFTVPMPFCPFCGGQLYKPNKMGERQ